MEFLGWLSMPRTGDRWAWTSWASLPVFMSKIIRHPSSWPATTTGASLFFGAWKPLLQLYRKERHPSKNLLARTGCVSTRHNRMKVSCVDTSK